MLGEIRIPRTDESTTGRSSGQFIVYLDRGDISDAS